MTEGPKAQGRPMPGRKRPPPLSPHLQIYSWPITMAASILHRATGVALAGGTLFLCCWIVAAASGAESYAVFAAAANHPIGIFVLFGFVWSLAYHLLNGIRHLAWDFGRGFKVQTAKTTAALVLVGSALLAGLVLWAGLLSRVPA